MDNTQKSNNGLIWAVVIIVLVIVVGVFAMKGKNSTMNYGNNTGTDQVGGSASTDAEVQAELNSIGSGLGQTESEANTVDGGTL